MLVYLNDLLNICLLYTSGIKYVRTTEQDVMGSRRERVGLYNPTAAQIR